MDLLGQVPADDSDDWFQSGSSREGLGSVFHDQVVVTNTASVPLEVLRNFTLQGTILCMTKVHRTVWLGVDEQVQIRSTKNTNLLR